MRIRRFGRTFPLRSVRIAKNEWPLLNLNNTQSTLVPKLQNLKKFVSNDVSLVIDYKKTKFRYIRFLILVFYVLLVNMLCLRCGRPSHHIEAFCPFGDTFLGIRRAISKNNAMNSGRKAKQTSNWIQQQEQDKEILLKHGNKVNSNKSNQ